jgi:DNA polymerase-3 subunit gamma/tau
VCDSCVSISTGEDIDVLEIDGASNRGIDEIRQLRQSASICPSRSHFKIYIIDEVHMLTREAFNALLKILEEPPEHVKFIFCTTEPSKIPITILSRCQRYDFAGIDTSKIAQHLAQIAANEGVTAEAGVFELLARRAAGSMRDAQSLLEQLLSFAPQNISLADVHNMLGTANDQLLFNLLDAILHCDTTSIFSEIETATSQGVDLAVLVEQMMGLLRDLLVLVSGGDFSLMLFCTPSRFEQAGKFANEYGLHRILAAMQILDQTYSRMRYNAQTRILIELALVRIAHLENFYMITTLLDKLRKGEIPINLPAEQQTRSQAEIIKPAKRIIQPAANLPTQNQPTPNQTIQNQPTQNLSAAQPTSQPNTPLAQTTNENGVTNSVALNQVGGQSGGGQGWGVELDKLDSARATEIWRAAVDSVPGMLGSSASVFLRVEFKKPNTFVVVFQNLTTKEYCERELQRLRIALCQTIGKTVQLRFLHEETKQPNRPNTPTIRISQESRAMFDSAANNVLVKKISEVFRTELQDVRAIPK